MRPSVLPTGAGHDAGIFSAGRVPTAMLFVRNPTGVSHSPAEHAEMDDCLAGVEALATVLKESATGDATGASGAAARTVPLGSWSTSATAVRVGHPGRRPAGPRNAWPG